MKKRTTLTVIVLVVAMLFSLVLVGCTDADTKTTEATQKATESAETTGEATAEPEDETTEEVNYEEAEVTLTYNAITAASEGNFIGWLDDYLVSKTGVELEMINLTIEKVQAMLASGEFTEMDFVCFNNNPEYFEAAITAGMLINLDDYKDSLPNAYNNEALAPAIQYNRDERSAGTGSLYGLPSGVGDYILKTDPGWYRVLVRWEIYDAIGQPEASTLEDLLGIFKQMQDYYPETEDGTKTYAISLFSEWDGTYAYCVQNFMNVLGYFCEGNIAKSFLELNLETLEAQEFVSKDSAYVRSLKFLFEANQLGILDPDSITQTYSNRKAKTNDGSILTATVASNNYNSDEHINADPPTGFATLLFDEYKAAVGGKSPVGVGYELAISADTDNLEACLRFMNFLSDETNLVTIYNGPQGDLWDINEDGNLYATDMYFNNINTYRTLELTGGGTLEEEVSGFNPTVPFRNSYKSAVYGSALGLEYWEDVIAATPRSKLDEKWTQDTGYEWTLDAMDGKVLYRPLLYSFIESNPDDIDIIRTQCSEVIIQYSWKMILAEDEDEFNTLLDEMITQCEGLGIDQVVSYGLENIEQAKQKAAKYE
jgi:putative aldouronate transport system substrate-binding protein